MARRDDTIVAVSSPPGRSRRGLLRLSGSEALCVVDAMTGDASGGGAGRRAHSAPRTLTVCRVRVTSDGAALPMLVARFDGPRSFTGQDMAELQCPGHPALLDRLVHRATELGARLAEPGEFTFRAFLAGKLDLTQAEGIAATIAARSDGQLQAATLLRRGALGRFAAAVVDELATQLALVEAGIDFVDAEDVVPIGPGALDDALARIAGRLASLSSRSRSWGAIEALPRVVLVGPPSAGKSTLFNALLGRRRAVVSPMPGTTRDVLAEPMTITSDGGRQVEVMLVDVAGLDAPGDALNEQVQAAARRAIEGADLIVNVNDGRAGQHRGDAAVLDSTEMAPRGTAVVYVRSKGDLSGPAPGGAARLSGPRPGARSAAQLTVSALTGEGVSALSAAIAGAMGRRGVSVAADMLALQPRHEAALRAAADHLDQARRLLAPQRQAHAIGGAELVAGALRAALDALAGLGGQMSPDDVIGRVFATFCVGK